MNSVTFAIRLASLVVLLSLFASAHAQFYPARRYGITRGFAGSPAPGGSTTLVAQVAESGTLKAFRQVNEPLPRFEHKGTVYTNAILEKVSMVTGFVRIEPGLVMVNLIDLPEPARSKYYDPAKLMQVNQERAAIYQKQAQARAEQAKTEADARERERQAQERERQFYIQSRFPIRVFQGKLYDLSEVIWVHRGDTLNTCDKVWLSGKIVSVATDGLLIETRESGPLATVFLRNHPKQESAVDGIQLATAAFHSGRYQYVAASGARRTVPSYDFGQPVAPGQKGFTQIIRLDGFGENQTLMPFTQSQ